MLHCAHAVVNCQATACGTILTAMSLVFPHTFVPWFRSVAPYIHAYRGKTFVVAIAGEGIAAGKLSAFVHDLAILLQPSGFDRSLQFGQVEAGARDGDARADVDALGEGEGRPGVAEAVELQLG